MWPGKGTSVNNMLQVRLSSGFGCLQLQSLRSLQSGSPSCDASLARPQHSWEHPARPSSPSVFCSRLQPSMNAGGLLCCASSEAFLNSPASHVCVACRNTKHVHMGSRKHAQRQNSNSAVLKK